MSETRGLCYIRFKCGEHTECYVKEALSEDCNPMYQIHMLKNCLHCDGKCEPSLEAIL